MDNTSTPSQESAKRPGDFFKTAGTIAYLLVLATGSCLVFWFVIHSREMRLLGSHTQTFSASSSNGFKSFAKKPLPHFSVTSLSGRRYDTRSLSRPLLVEVFATWCPHCQKMVPSLNKLVGDGKVDLLAITGDTRGANHLSESIDDIKNFQRKFGVRYDLAFDPGTVIAKRLGVVGFPSIYVLDRSGKVLFNAVGEVPEAVIRNAIAIGTVYSTKK